MSDHLLDAVRYAMSGCHWHYGGGFAPYDEEEERIMTASTGGSTASADMSGHSLSGGSECYHDWTLYEGFTETYHFCKKCDEKKKDNK